MGRSKEPTLRVEPHRARIRKDGERVFEEGHAPLPGPGQPGYRESRKGIGSQGRPPLPETLVRRRADELVREKQAKAAAELRLVGRIELTRDDIGFICDQVAIGNYPATAAQALGIPPARFSGWMAEGRRRWNESEEGEHEEKLFTRDDPLGLRVLLYLLVSREDALLEMSIVHAMQDRIDAERQWQGYMTILERRYNERWSRRDPDGTRRAHDSLEQRVFSYIQGRADQAREGDARPHELEAGE